MIREGQVGMTWLGQSGFALRFGPASVLIDAFLSPHSERLVPAPIRAAEASGFDIIACTHEHLDHLDLDSLPDLAAASPEALVVVPRPCVDMVVDLGISPDRVIGVQSGQAADVNGVTLHAIPACHGLHAEDGYSFGDGRFLGYVIACGGPIVYHAGDTIVYEGLAARLRELHIDVALLPINGRDAQREAIDIVGNMDADEAAQLAAEAGADLVVPMHYDMFASNPGYPERIVEAVRLRHPGLGVVVPARGREFVYARSTA